MANHPRDLPLSDTAIVSPRIVTCLGLAKDGEIFLVFPRSTPYAKIERMAKNQKAEIYRVYARVSYEILNENEFYDTEPRVTL